MGVPLERVARVSFDDEVGQKTAVLTDDDLGFKLEGTRISTTSEDTKATENWSVEEKRKLFEKKKIIPIAPSKGGGGRKRGAGAKVAAPKYVRDLERYPLVSKVLDDPDTQDRIMQNLDDYMSYLKPAERQELIAGLLRMELSKETSKL